MSRSLLVAAVAASIAWAGCSIPSAVGGPCSAFNTGEEPCREQLYFPAGIAVDPRGDEIYVSNDNADLRYAGGTLSAIDAVKFECARAFVAAGYSMSGFSSLPPKLAQACTSYGDLAKLGPSNGNPEAGCQRNAFDPSIIECDEQSFIDDAVKIGNFGGEIRVQKREQAVEFPVLAASCPAGSTPVAAPALPPVACSDATVMCGATCVDTSRDPANCGACGAACPSGDTCFVGSCAKLCKEMPTATRRLWLPVRGDPSITFVDATDHGLPGAPGTRRGSLSCGGPAPGGETLASCTNQRITQRDVHPGVPGAPTTSTALPPEPFGISLDGCVGPQCAVEYERLMVSHLAGGELTLINAHAFSPASTADIAPTEPVVLDVRTGFFPVDAQGRHNAFAVGPRTPGDPLSLWYATSQTAPLINMVRVAEAGLIVPAGDFSIAGGPLAAGDDIRAFAFEPGGNRAFFLDNHPPSLFTLDTRIDPNGFPAGQPANAVVDAVPVCPESSHLGVRRTVEPGAAGEPPRLVTRVYVVCTTNGQVVVVDPDLAQVDSTFVVGGGAYDLAFNFADADCTPDTESCAGPAPIACASDGDCPSNDCQQGTCASLPRRAYVTNFLDMTVSVVDLERGSPTENRVIGRIGLTTTGAM